MIVMSPESAGAVRQLAIRGVWAVCILVGVGLLIWLALDGASPSGLPLAILARYWQVSNIGVVI
jgi:hypothetical protein